MSVGARFSIEQAMDPVFAEEAIILVDNEIGSSARVIPSLGDNLMSFVAGMANGRKIDVIMGAPSGENPGRASRWGNPILFPFPNRVEDARYHWHGREYHLPVNTLEGNHIHGLVRDLPWRVDDAGAGAQGAFVRCSFIGQDHPEFSGQYPFPFVLTVTYTLVGNVLRLDVRVENCGAEQMPMGFGIHPYFRAPLEGSGKRESCVVYVPAAKMWEQNDEKIPTGKVIESPPELDFRNPRPLDNVILDHVYTDLIRETGQTEAWLTDPEARVRISVRFGPEFPDLVVLAPSDRSTVAFEPYTCVTNAVNLAERHQKTGLIVLPPGRRWNGTVWFDVSNA